MTAESPFRRFLDEQRFVFLDGGLATALEAAGQRLDSALWSARMLIDAPDAVRAVHAAYLEAGADCISTAGYQASFEGFDRIGLSTAEAEAVLRSSVRLALEARATFWSHAGDGGDRLEPIVAASMGPYGAFLADGSEYDGRYGVSPRVLDAFHRRRLEVLSDTDADVLAFETIPSITEAGVIGALIAESPAPRAWVSFTCRDGACLWDGSPVAEAVEALGAERGLAGVGVNCTHPDHVAELIDRIGAVTDLPMIAYPNSGEAYDPVTKSWTGEPPDEEWIESARRWVAAGARIVGGCCRVGPELIRGLRASLSVP